jgi:hypothetical protein
MVSSCYPVFAGKNPENGVKVLTECFNLKVAHHFSSELLEYYVLVDTNGNHMDLMRHNMVEEMGFFGMRLNVDDFDAMAEFLKAQGYVFAFGPFDVPSAIVAVMVNPTNPNAHRYVVSHHKKG